MLWWACEDPQRRAIRSSMPIERSRAFAAIDWRDERLRAAKCWPMARLVPARCRSGARPMPTNAKPGAESWRHGSARPSHEEGAAERLGDAGAMLADAPRASQTEAYCRSRQMQPILVKRFQLCGYEITRPKNPNKNVGAQRKMAETKGFEPSRQFPVCTLSRGVPSTTRPRLRRPVYCP